MGILVLRNQNPLDWVEGRAESDAIKIYFAFEFGLPAQYSNRLDDTAIERVFTAGGGAPATIGRTKDGELMVPAISLHYLVPGLRAVSDKARKQEIDFLVGGFHDVVYI